MEGWAGGRGPRNSARVARAEREGGAYAAGRAANKCALWVRWSDAPVAARERRSGGDRETAQRATLHPRREREGARVTERRPSARAPAPSAKAGERKGERDGERKGEREGGST
jgi:hypothetical protein